MTDTWGSDVPVSLPRPIPADQTDDVNIDMYGFRFSPRGLQHNVSASDLEALLATRFAPQHHDEQRGDADLDN